MSKMDGAFRKFNSALKEHGLRMEPWNKHAAIVDIKTGKRVYSISSTPREPNCIMFAIQDMVREGILPPEMKRKKFTA
jgi:hypothetical protein